MEGLFIVLLLFGLCYITISEASCIIPSILNADVKAGPRETNIVLKPNDFVNSGTYIYFECNDGYTRTGSYYNLCSGNDQYAFRNPTCNPNSCHVRDLIHGWIAVSQIQHGEYVKYGCHAGWEKTTDEPILCDLGTLVGHTSGHGCVRPQCRIPPLPANMISAQEYPDNKVKHQHHFTFTCESGYRLEKQQHTFIYCNSGRWPSTGIGNTCLPEPCSAPVDPSHGTFLLSKGTGYFQDSIITLECDEGYRVRTESSMAECREGHWTSLPTCELDLPANGNMCEYPQLFCDLRIFLDGREIQFHEFQWIPHKSSIVLASSQSDVSRSLCNDGNWVPAIEACRSTPGCPALTIPSNVTVTGGGSSYKSIRAFTCPEGYTTVNGDSVVTSECGEDGQWTNQPPNCSVEMNPDITAVPAVNPCVLSSRCEDWQMCILVNGEAMCFCKHPHYCPYSKGPQICGTDGRNYTNLCNLKTIACFFDRDIAVASDKPCPSIEAMNSNDDYSLYSVYSADYVTEEIRVTEIPETTNRLFTQMSTDKDLNCGVGLGPFANDDRGRIVDGNDAAPGAWPWMVGLYKYLEDFREFDDYHPEFLCGGSLISNDTVLTAAHCFDDYWANKENIIVAAGSNVRITDRERFHNSQEYLQVLQVAEIIQHEQYRETVAYDYDIALLRLQTVVNITSMVKPVCLPESKYERNNDLLQFGVDGPTYPYVTGWGHTKEFANKYSVDLKQSAMPLRNRTTCAKSLEIIQEFTGSMICAGFIEGEQTDRGELITYTGQKDACNGDSGGPLVRARAVGGNDIYYQIGIVSWGHDCALKDTYGFYTNVTLLVDWINNKTAGMP